MHQPGSSATNSAANQPRIVNAGSIDVALIYDGSNDSMSIASLPFGTPYINLYMKSRIADQAGAAIAYETSTNYNSNAGAIIVYMDSNQISAGLRNSVSFRRDFNPTNQTALQQNTFRFQMAVADWTISQQILLVNGANQVGVFTLGSAATPVLNFTSQTMYIGARAGSSLFYPLWDETLVIYDADTTSIRTSIEAIVA